MDLTQLNQSLTTNFRLQSNDSPKIPRLYLKFVCYWSSHEHTWRSLELSKMLLETVQHWAARWYVIGVFQLHFCCIRKILHIFKEGRRLQLSMAPPPLTPAVNPPHHKSDMENQNIHPCGCPISYPLARYPESMHLKLHTLYTLWCIPTDTLNFFIDTVGTCWSNTYQHRSMVTTSVLELWVIWCTGCWKTGWLG
jgi:hypothetical protein